MVWKADMSVVSVRLEPNRQSTKKNNKYHLLYVYMVYLLMMG